MVLTVLRYTIDNNDTTSCCLSTQEAKECMVSTA